MIIRTGKFLNERELHTLYEEYKKALNTPMIVISERIGDESANTMRDFHDALNEAVMAIGFPHPGSLSDGTPINYGCDFSNGEILTWADDHE